MREGGQLRVGAILTSVPNARLLVALCSFTKVRATVLETSAGPFAVLDDATEESLTRAASALSGFLKGSQFLAFAAREEHVMAHLWVSGTVQREVPSGLALAEAPGVLTTILTGAQTLDQIAQTHPDKVHPANLGRFAAYRALVAETRALRRRSAQG